MLRFVEAEKARSAPHVVTEEAYRACHTLSGSSRMAEARHGIRLAAPLEHWVRKAFDSGIGLESGDLDLLADCMNAMQSVAAHLDESTGYFQSHGALLGRIERAEGRQRAGARGDALQVGVGWPHASQDPFARQQLGRGLLDADDVEPVPLEEADHQP